jgi:hypothetical protein
MRLQVLRRDRFLCARCGAARLRGRSRRPLRAGRARRDPANLRSLCSRCHARTTRWARTQTDVGRGRNYPDPRFPFSPTDSNGTARRRGRGVSSVLRKFALGPGFWKRVSAAEAKPPLDQSAWERGLATMARQYESPRTLVWPIQTVLAAAVGVPLGNAVAVNSWVVQALVGELRHSSCSGSFRRSALPSSPQCQRRSNSATRPASTPMNKKPTHMNTPNGRRGVRWPTTSSSTRWRRPAAWINGTFLPPRSRSAGEAMQPCSADKSMTTEPDPK